MKSSCKKRLSPRTTNRVPVSCRSPVRCVPGSQPRRSPLSRVLPSWPVPEHIRKIADPRIFCVKRGFLNIRYAAEKVFYTEGDHGFVVGFQFRNVDDVICVANRVQQIIRFQHASLGRGNSASADVGIQNNAGNIVKISITRLLIKVGEIEIRHSADSAAGAVGNQNAFHAIFNNHSEIAFTTAGFVVTEKNVL